MPKYAVQLERGGRRFELQVEADDRQSAEALALEEISGAKYSSQDERLDKIARLESELAEVKEAQMRGPESLLGKVATSLRGALPFGNQQQANQFGRAIEDAGAQMGTVVGTGARQAGAEVLQAGADLAALAGSERAGEMSEWLQDYEARIEQEATDKRLDDAARAAGRPLSSNEQKEIADTLGDQIGYAKFGTQLAAGFGLGGLAMKGATTVPRALAMGAGEGLFAGTFLADAEGDTAEDRAKQRVLNGSIGAALGGIVNGVVVGIPAGVKNQFGKYVRRQIDAAGGVERYDQMVEDLGTSVSLGQFTGSPSILLAEANAAGDAGGAFFREQKRAAIRNIASRHGVNLPATERLGEGVATYLDDYVGTLNREIYKRHSDINRAYRSRLDDIYEEFDGPVLGLGDEVEDTLVRIMSEVEATYGQKGLGEGFRKMLREMAVSLDGATAKQLNDWQTYINGAKKARGYGVFSDMDKLDGAAREQAEGQAIAYLNAINHGLKQAIQSGKPLSAQGAKALDAMQTARATYGEAKTGIKRLEQELITSLGMHGKGASEIIRNLRERDPEQIRAAIKLIKNSEGGVQAIKSLRDGMIHQAALDASAGAAMKRGAMSGEFSLGDFIEAYGRNTESSVLGELLSPTQRAYGNRAIQHLRSILNSSQVEPGIMKTHLNVDLSAVAINAASRDPGFIARLLGATIERGKGADWLFHSREGINMLRNLDQVAAGRVRGPQARAITHAATITLLDMISEPDGG